MSRNARGCAAAGPVRTVPGSAQGSLAAARADAERASRHLLSLPSHPTVQQLAVAALDAHRALAHLSTLASAAVAASKRNR